ncbi:hypothetical protein GRF29_28g2071426 [Pseudopithomyces chartarum]|uniref:Protein kinase domain-containing protein n=1 Tax=Pseudopithomyces chartarum TaxID=1892770 RepID=A0AAN6RK79_9PLEO|nr:hypothetical protein GRF29_28g2071426 [Pseudopithomyces chartarum]
MEENIFVMDDALHADNVNYTTPKVDSGAIEAIENCGKFIYIKPAGKTHRNDLLFCLPTTGQSIADLEVVKVKDDDDQNLNRERAVLKEIHERLPEEHRSRFPQVKGHGHDGGKEWLAMTGYSRPITMDDLVKHCIWEQVPLPKDLFALLICQITRLYAALNRIGVQHGDTHEGNILLQAPETDIQALPSVNIIDFGTSRTIQNTRGLVSMMNRVITQHPIRSKPDGAWEAFQAKVEDWHRDSPDSSEILRVLQELVHKIDANEHQLSGEAQVILNTIAENKRNNRLWVTDEDISWVI